MRRRKKSTLPYSLITILLLFAVGFAIFGKSTPMEESPTAEGVGTLAPAPQPPLPAVIEMPAAEPEPEPAQEPEPEPEPVALTQADRLTQQFNELYDSGSLQQGREVLAKLFVSEEISDARRAELAQKSMKISQQLVVMEPDGKNVIIHEVGSGEVLTTIARKYRSLHGQWGIIAVVNRILNPNHLRVGKKLRIPMGTWSLFADKSMFRMWLMYDGIPFKEYEIATGKDNKTPATTFVVTDKTPQPDWYPPENTGLKGKIPYGDKRNPLGDYWIAMQHDVYDGFGIHGTNDESVIGTAVSNGCIRMHNEDVVEMAQIAFKGMTVTIVE